MKNILKKLLMLVLIATVGTSGLSVKAAETPNDDFLLDDVGHMVLVDTYVEQLDDECYAVIEDYTEIPANTRATVKTVEKARHYYIRRASDNAVMVQFSLHGTFTYNGSTSSCTNAWMNTYNNNSTVYSIVNKSTSRSGIYATGNCAAKNKNTGTIYSKTLRIGVKADGTTLMP